MQAEELHGEAAKNSDTARQSSRRNDLEKPILHCTQCARNPSVISGFEQILTFFGNQSSLSQTQSLSRLSQSLELGLYVSRPASAGQGKSHWLFNVHHLIQGIS